MEQAMIMVAGGTGTTGGEVIRLMQEKGEPFMAMVRSAANADKLQAKGIDTILADLSDPASLSPAMKGVESFFLLSASVSNQADLQLNAVEAAEVAGVGFIVKVSVVGADPDSPLTLGRAHAEVEEGLAASGVPHAVLRAGSFMQNFLGSADTIKSQDQFYGSSGNGKIAMIDARDVAAAAVALLTSQEPTGGVFTLTGPEALSNAEAAAVISEVVGREIRYMDVSGDALKAGLLDAGLEEWLVDDLVALNKAFAGGAGEGVTDDVERLTGRPARTFAQFVADYAGAFGKNGP
jgi:uncharacterized protein YbjT (DUF2867 family)